jgi:uncharacterized membrane protein YfcA
MDTAALVPLAVALITLVAGTLAAVAGFGGAVVLLPVLVWAFGVRDAVPILTVAQLVGNASRVWFNRRELVLPVAGWFALGAVPLTVAGGVLFAAAPAPFLQRLLGVFLLLTLVYRRIALGQRSRVGVRGFAVVGAAFGFLSALVGTVGPLAAPFFLSYGLVKGAYIGTEALTAVTTHAVKLGVYGGYALLGLRSLLTGLAVGGVLLLGAFIGKRLLDRVPERVFPRLIEAVLLLSGLQLLLT